jgi:hypothetical protein
VASAVGLPWGSDTQTKLATGLKVTRAEEFPDVREEYQLCLPKQADRALHRRRKPPTWLLALLQGDWPRDPAESVCRAHNDLGEKWKAFSPGMGNSLLFRRIQGVLGSLGVRRTS